tara:strand:- start:3561 stop:3743 length:183 start_codon:yes stop_codon:yes gene_type:complete
LKLVGAYRKINAMPRSGLYIYFQVLGCIENITSWLFEYRGAIPIAENQIVLTRHHLGIDY